MDRLRSKSYEEREFHLKGGDNGGMKGGGPQGEGGLS